MYLTLFKIRIKLVRDPHRERIVESSGRRRDKSHYASRYRRRAAASGTYFNTRKSESGDPSVFFLFFFSKKTLSGDGIARVRTGFNGFLRFRPEHTRSDRKTPTATGDTVHAGLCVYGIREAGFFNLKIRVIVRIEISGCLHCDFV